MIVLQKGRYRQYDSVEERRAYQKARRDDNRIRLIAGRGCVRCGIEDPRVLEFHHRDPATKSFTVGGNMDKALWRLQEEAAKCDLICANCHAIEHSNF